MEPNQPGNHPQKKQKKQKKGVCPAMDTPQQKKSYNLCTPEKATMASQERPSKMGETNNPSENDAPGISQQERHDKVTPQGGPTSRTKPTNENQTHGGNQKQIF